MTQIKSKMDRKPGAARFTDMLDPENAMATTPNDAGATLQDTIYNSQMENSKSIQQESQPIRIDKSLWLRLKSFQLALEAQGQRKTLQDMNNEALAAYLTAHEN